MSHVTSPARHVVLIGAGCLLAIAAFAGCSADKTNSETGTTPSPSQTASATQSSSADVCADVDTAEASLQALVDTNIAQEGTNTLKARFVTFESDVQTLVESGQAELAPKTEAVKESIATLKEVLAGLTEDPTAGDLALVEPSLQAVKTSTEDLITSLDSTC